MKRKEKGFSRIKDGKEKIEILDLLTRHIDLINKRIDSLERINCFGLQLLGNIPYLVFFDSEKNKYYYIKVEFVKGRKG